MKWTLSNHKNEPSLLFESDIGGADQQISCNSRCDCRQGMYGARSDYHSINSGSSRWLGEILCLLQDNAGPQELAIRRISCPIPGTQYARLRGSIRGVSLHPLAHVIAAASEARKLSHLRPRYRRRSSNLASSINFCSEFRTKRLWPSCRVLGDLVIIHPGTACNTLPPGFSRIHPINVPTSPSQIESRTVRWRMPDRS